MSVIVDEQHPALFVIMLDQSFSMGLPFSIGLGKLKSDIVASAVNHTIFELALKSMSRRNQNKMKDKFEIALVKYNEPEDSPEIGSAFKGSLEGRHVVKITELFENSIDEDADENPIWVVPEVAGSTPMKQAIMHVKDICYDWINGSENHTHCNPPVVLNITDGQATDLTDPYDFSDLADEIGELKKLRTAHGEVLYYNLFLSDIDQNCKFPSLKPNDLDKYGDFLFKHSSFLTREMKEMAERDYNMKFDGKNPRGIIVNGEESTIQDFLMVGTVGTIVTGK